MVFRDILYKFQLPIYVIFSTYANKPYAEIPSLEINKAIFEMKKIATVKNKTRRAHHVRLDKITCYSGGLGPIHHTIQFTADHFDIRSVKHPGISTVEC